MKTRHGIFFVPGTVVTSRFINIVLLSDTCHSSSGTLSDGVLYQLSMIASGFTATVTQVCLECGARVCCPFQTIGGHWEINQKFYFQPVGKYDKRCLDKSMAFFIQVQWDDNYWILLFLVELFMFIGFIWILLEVRRIFYQNCILSYQKWKKWLSK